MITAEQAAARLAYIASLMPEIPEPSLWFYVKRWLDRQTVRNQREG